MELLFGCVPGQPRKMDDGRDEKMAFESERQRFVFVWSVWKVESREASKAS